MFAVRTLFRTDVMMFAHIVVDCAVSSWVLTTKTMAHSSTWLTRLASPTWVYEVVRLLMMVVVVVRLWLCVCVCTRFSRVTGVVPLEKQNRLQRQRLRSYRWGPVNADQTQLVGTCSCNCLCVCVCVTDEGDDMQRAGQRGRQNVSGHGPFLLRTSLCYLYVCTCIHLWRSPFLTPTLSVFVCMLYVQHLHSPWRGEGQSLRAGAQLGGRRWETHCTRLHKLDTQSTCAGC